MRILMLTQWFQPESFVKGLPLAKAWRSRGHHVEVLTGFPNYPGGRIYPGYSIRPWRRETMDQVVVNRVPLYPSHDRSGWRRALNYASFGASAALVGPWLVQRPDVVYVYNLITLGFAAGILRHLHGCKIVLDVQDLWPESVTTSGMMKSPMLLQILQEWCAAEYRRPDRLIVLSPGFKRHLARAGVSESQIDVVYNWCDEASVVVPPANDELAAELNFKGRFNIVFAGTMGIAQNLDIVIGAADLLRLEAPDALFTLVGGGTDLERLKSAAAGRSNIQFLPMRPMSEIGSIYAVADALLVHLRDDPLFEMTIPSKIQAYLHVGKPILCGVRGDAARLVESAGAGLVFAPGDARSLADAVKSLCAMSQADRDRMGEAGKAHYRSHLSFERGVAALESVFKKAVG